MKYSQQQSAPLSDGCDGRDPAKLGVLVVDDEHCVRIMVQLGLEQYGFDVWVAAGGHEAIRLYREHRDRIGVVLLDVQMPLLDGPETLDALRALNPDIRACFMTGHLGEYEPKDLMRRGALSIVTKPFLLQHISRILRLAAQGRPVEFSTLPNGHSNE